MRKKSRRFERRKILSDFRFPDYREFERPIRYDLIHTEQVDLVVRSLEWESRRTLVEEVSFEAEWPKMSLASFVPRVMPVDYTPQNTDLDWRVR